VDEGVGAVDVAVGAVDVADDVEVLVTGRGVVDVASEGVSVTGVEVDELARSTSFST